MLLTLKQLNKILLQPFCVNNWCHRVKYALEHQGCKIKYSFSKPYVLTFKNRCLNLVIRVHYQQAISYNHFHYESIEYNQIRTFFESYCSVIREIIFCNNCKKNTLNHDKKYYCYKKYRKEVEKLDKLICKDLKKIYEHVTTSPKTFLINLSKKRKRELYDESLLSDLDEDSIDNDKWYMYPDDYEFIHSDKDADE